LLPTLGYEFGTTIHLYPDDERKMPAFPSFRSSDLVVLTTRPATSMIGDSIPRKHIRGTKSNFEEAIFTEIAQVLPILQPQAC